MSKNYQKQNDFEDHAERIEDAIVEFEKRWGIDQTHNLLLHLIEQWGERQLERFRKLIKHGKN